MRQMLTDAELPGLADQLGIPGFVDIHTHFMPERVMVKVWARFDAEDSGHTWPIHYRYDEETRLRILEKLRVIRFTSLNYAHRPGMAAWLNAWSGQFADGHPACARSATFYPEDGVADYTAAALSDGVQIFKLHLVVGNFDPWDERLRPVWAQIEAAGIPVVIHAGAFPVSTPWTGAERLGAVLAAHPELRLVIAHLGAPDVVPLWELGMRYPNVHWDTTMSFTDRFRQAEEQMPPEIVAAIGLHPERIVFGSDFPNVPHPYAHQIDALHRLGFGDDWLRQVLFENGARLLGYERASAR